jgi:hypothetical protein
MTGENRTTDSVESGSDHPGLGERVNAVAHRVIAGAIVLAALVGAYFLLEAFLPRWWAQQVGRMVGGTFSRGIGSGLVIGFVCTVIPILLIVFAVISRGRLKNVPALVCAIAAIIVVIPNLLTLAVVAGGGNGSHAGERIFDVDAPGFRGASLGGAIAGALAAIVAAYFIWGYRRRGRKLDEARAAQT